MSTEEGTISNGVASKTWHDSCSKLLFKRLEVSEPWISSFSCLTMKELSSSSGSYTTCRQSYNWHIVADIIVVQWYPLPHSCWNLLTRWGLWEVTGQEVSCSVTVLLIMKRACGRGSFSFSSFAEWGHWLSMDTWTCGYHELPGSRRTRDKFPYKLFSLRYPAISIWRGKRPETEWELLWFYTSQPLTGPVHSRGQTNKQTKQKQQTTHPEGLGLTETHRSLRVLSTTAELYPQL